MNDCILTVYCLAYNHGKYIEETLKGFVNQKTSYKFKVVIHDDASTDATPSIIQRYAEKYPEIIQPIFQSENQYQKKINIYENYFVPVLEGKYVAVCEGDDYWCDENKLQIQIDYMEKNPGCSLCVHNTMMIDDKGRDKGILFNNSKSECTYSVENVIECGGGGLFHTSSFVYRRELRAEKPSEFRMTRVGDYPLAMYFAMRGEVHYFPQIMSKYRVGSINSWVKNNSATIEKMKEISNIHIEELKKLDEITGFQYTHSFKIAQDRIVYKVLIKEGKIREILFSPEYRMFFYENSLCKRMRMIIKIIIEKMKGS